MYIYIYIYIYITGHTWPIRSGSSSTAPSPKGLLPKARPRDAAAPLRGAQCPGVRGGALEVAPCRGRETAGAST